MNDQTIPKILAIINQRIPIEQMQSILRQLQAESPECESAFISALIVLNFAITSSVIRKVRTSARSFLIISAIY